MVNAFIKCFLQKPANFPNGRHQRKALELEDGFEYWVFAYTRISKWVVCEEKMLSG
jgi:hypothetical protein